jgi:hypothetical protein
MNQMNVRVLQNRLSYLFALFMRLVNGFARKVRKSNMATETWICTYLRIFATRHYTNMIELYFLYVFRDDESDFMNICFIKTSPKIEYCMMAKELPRVKPHLGALSLIYTCSNYTFHFNGILHIDLVLK